MKPSNACKLLAEHEVTYSAALRIAQGLETATKNLKEMRQPGSKASLNPPMKVKTEPVHKVQAKGAGIKLKLTCHRCGAPGHLANKCRFKDSVCHKCGKTGHLIKVCRSKALAKLHCPKGGGARLVRHVEEESSSEESVHQPIQQISVMTQGDGR